MPANPETVKLISAEGWVFVLDRKVAMVSNTIKNMLSSQGSFTETELGEINFPDIPTPVLEKVCQYFHYKTRYTNSTTFIPEFKIEPDLALDLLMAANFLDA